MKTLIIFTIAGSTFSFKNVDDFNLGSDHISFSYSGQLTGRRNRATFYHISMVGYSWLGELEKEEFEDDAVEELRKQLRKDIDDRKERFESAASKDSKRLRKDMTPEEELRYYKNAGLVL